MLGPRLCMYGKSMVLSVALPSFAENLEEQASASPNLQNLETRRLVAEV